MKKIIKMLCGLTALVLSLSLIFAGCSGENEQSATSADHEETQALTTTQSAETTQAEEVKWQWEKDLPENQGFDGGVLDSLYSQFNSFDLLSCVIVKNEKIIDEFYKDGYDEQSRFILNSASKSVTSALVGIAIDKGYIDNVDVRISQYFPDEDFFEDERAQRITIRHLLEHTSGMGSTDTDLWYDWRASDNWLAYIFDLPMEAEPGTQFNYSTGNTHLLSAIVQQATGMTLYEFGKAYLFDPVGMDSVACPTNAQGICDGGNGFEMTVYDMLKFGQLYLNEGVWEGEQIISQVWIEQSTSVQYDRPSGSADYGYQWWVRTFGNNGYDAFFAQGHAGQYIFVVPEVELVIAVTSDYTGSTGIYWQIANEIVNACE